MMFLTSVSSYKSVLFTALVVSFTFFLAGCGGGSSDSPIPITPDFTVSDLDGKASMHGISLGLQGSGDGNFKGWLDMTSGNIIGGYFANSKGLEAPLTGGSISVKETGEFSGTAVAAGQYNYDVYSGKISQSKDIFVWVDTSADVGTNDLSMAIKEGGTYATSDLAGTWHMFGTSVNGGAFGGDSEGTLWGSYDINANGNMDGGSLSTSDDIDMSVVGGTLAMNSDGYINGTVTVFAGQDFDVTFDSGKMDPSKNIMFITTQTEIGSSELMVLVKGGGTFSTADMEGKWYLHGVSMGGDFGGLAISGSLEQDASGKVIDGDYSLVGEATGLQPIPATFTPGGTMALNASGELSGSIDVTIHGTPQGDIHSTITIVSGKMAPSKNIVVFVVKTSIGQNALMISIKGN